MRAEAEELAKKEQARIEAEQMVIETIDQLLVDKEARLIRKVTGHNIN